MSGIVHRQQHGYRNGHQLLTGSVKLSRADQDLVDRLSDISGPLKPGQQFEPYVTGYSLPSGTYYVLAKTWQDREAPRAGCVLTQSIFLSSDHWSSPDGVRDAFALISRLSPHADALNGNSNIDHVSAPVPAVSDDRLPALVEALFLEERQPIVVFDVRSAENIVERLLMSLWPAARRNFAICTYALGPRKTGGREFDLVFAPNDARSRFAEWKGRRIEPGPSSSTARHRWTAQILNRIFAADTPSLPLTALPAELQRGNRNDESVLRLALLWEELSQRVPVSKNAALGLLDILNSQGVSPEAVPELEPVLRRAIDMAVTSDQADAWSFLAALATKVDATELKKLSDALTSASAALTHRDAIASLGFVQELRSEGRDLPRSLLKGLGNGLALEPSSFIANSEHALPFDLTVSLLAASANFARTLLSRTVLQSEDYVTSLAREILSSDAEKRRDVRINVIPCLKGSGGALLLEALLANASARDVVETISIVGETTNFEQKAFDMPLIEAAIDADVLVQTREIAWNSHNISGADRFILKSLRSEEDDVVWLAQAPRSQRRTDLATRYVDAIDHHELIRLMRHTAARDALLGILAEDTEQSAKQLTRVLASANAPILQTAEIGALVWPWLSVAERSNLASRILERTLRDASPQEWPVTDRFFREAAPAIHPRQLIQLATSTTASASVIAHNLELMSSTTQLSEKLASSVGELTERLTKRRRENLGANAYEAWAHLLSRADPSAASTVRAAASAFDAVIRLTQYPVSPIVVATFPIFYRHLPSKKNVGVFWTEIDRRKSARSALVDAYMQSTWPPSDLILAAIGADIADKIVGRIERSYKAQSFVGAIIEDAARLKPKEKKAVLRALEDEFDFDY